MSTSIKRLLVAALILLAGCGSGPAAGQADKTYRLIVSGRPDEHSEVLSTARQDRPFLLPPGILSPDGSRLYSIGWGDAGGTSLVAYETSSGHLLKTQQMSQAWQTDGGGISHNGRWLVLSAPPSLDGTAFAVVGSNLTGPVETLSLPGRFGFDAISDDGALLYLIQYLAGTSYEVRLYNLRAGVLDDHPVVAKGPDVEVMNGSRATAVADPSGDRLYSLYLRPGQAPFVHVLDLDERFAFCIDFPALPLVPGYDPLTGSGWSLDLDSAHQRLYAVLGQGLVVTIDTAELSVAGMSHFASAGAAGWRLPFIRDAQAKEIDSFPSASALNSSGGSLFVAVSSGLVKLDTQHFGTTSLAPVNSRLTGLVLSADGRRLFALSPMQGQVLELDPADGKVLGRYNQTVASLLDGGRVLVVAG